MLELRRGRHSGPPSLHKFNETGVYDIPITIKDFAPNRAKLPIFTIHLAKIFQILPLHVTPITPSS